MDIRIGQDARGPLAGIRVLDISAVVSGPLCGQILGDLGADVIKLEAPRGDTTRKLGVPAAEGLTSLFVQVNRNKRAVSIDLKQERGRELAQRLAASVDVLLENFRPGVAERLGLAYEPLAEANPKLIYVSINGFGDEGPYRDLPAYDTVIQGLSGFMPVQGGKGAPQLVKSIVADKTTALTASYGVLAALLARERGDGRGQRVVVPMLDSYAAFMLPDILGAESFPPAEAPSREIPDVHRTWATLDGHVVMMIVEDDQFAAICQALEREDLIEDPRCANLVTRILHANELFEILEQEVARFPTAELVERARKLGAPLAPANTLGDFIADPQVAANGTVFSVDHERAGTLRLVRNPVRFSATPTGLRRLPPGLGAETDEILAEAGLGHEEIEKLREDGTVR